jgi:hypothetical protein
MDASSVLNEAVIAEARRRHRRRRARVVALLAVALLVLLLSQPWSGSSPTGHGASHATRQAARRRAAAPVPGVFYDEQTGKPSVVCVTRTGSAPGGGLARTPTKQDLRRFQRRYQKTHTLPREPGTLSLHELSNGKVAGTCNYGPGPKTLANDL